MVRVGRYTGKIYEKGYPINKIGECCILVRNDDLEEASKKYGKKCCDIRCRGGCLESIKNSNLATSDGCLETKDMELIASSIEGVAVNCSGSGVDTISDTTGESQESFESMLRPCPFCGSTDVHTTDAWPYYAYCPGCGIKMQISGSCFGDEGIEKVAEAWNRRV